MFNHESLRLIRLFKGLTLDDVAQRIKTTRQYVYALENGNRVPTEQHLFQLCLFFGVKKTFFYKDLYSKILETEVHFRKLRTTKQATKLQTISRLELASNIIDALEDELNFPLVNFNSTNHIGKYSLNDIEDLSLRCRELWGLGLNPISNVIRLVENNGCIVLNMDETLSSVDALSIFKSRPIILRNTFKPSTSRLRFDIAHEIGHFVLHNGLKTGDKNTEAEANSFASAFLLPKKIMYFYFPKPRNNRFNWQEITNFKLKWKVSKSAILYRAHTLGLITDKQYKTAVIQLRCNGEAITEKEDNLINKEKPEIIEKAINFLGTDAFFMIEKKLGLKESTIRQVLCLPRNDSNFKKILKI